MLNKILRANNLGQKIQFYKTTAIKQPKLKMRTCEQILPPPGMNLQIPGFNKYLQDWEPEKFLLKIGGGTSEYADKFDNIKEIFETSSKQMKEKGLPAMHRKYIKMRIEQLRRGHLNFEYLERRLATEIKPPAKK